MIAQNNEANMRLLVKTAAENREQLERVCSGLRDELTTTARNEAKHAALITRDINSDHLEAACRVVARQSNAASAGREAQHAPPATPVPEQPVALDDRKVDTLVARLKGYNPGLVPRPGENGLSALNRIIDSTAAGDRDCGDVGGVMETLKQKVADNGVALIAELGAPQAAVSLSKLHVLLSEKLVMDWFGQLGFLGGPSAFAKPAPACLSVDETSGLKRRVWCEGRDLIQAMSLNPAIEHMKKWHPRLTDNLVVDWLLEFGYLLLPELPILGGNDHASVSAASPPLDASLLQSLWLRTAQEGGALVNRLGAAPAILHMSAWHPLLTVAQVEEWLVYFGLLKAEPSVPSSRLSGAPIGLKLGFTAEATKAASSTGCGESLYGPVDESQYATHLFGPPEIPP